MQTEEKQSKYMMFLCLNKNHYMNTYQGVEVQLQVFLTSAIGRGEWSASRCGHFTPDYPLNTRLGGRSGEDNIS
jgi:hypothetical protein